MLPDSYRSRTPARLVPPERAAQTHAEHRLGILAARGAQRGRPRSQRAVFSICHLFAYYGKDSVCCRKLAAMGGVVAENLLDQDSPRPSAPDSEYAKDEAGTAPGDRTFRPDVEGLRAVAILTVILYHAHVPPFTGGYIGVDVFFVISGFVITGVLLRERSATEGTSLLHFYARRVRRILPAAILVILATVVVCYVVIGTVNGNNAANDGRWAAIFLANYHFWSQGTSYFGSLLPPSPLQNFWSLAVEEQFYIVYPTIFLLCASIGGRISLRVRMAVALGAIFVVSYWYSIVETSSHPSVAYFSPFTRAWELALGALVAISTPQLKRIPDQLAAVATWLGFGLILLASILFTSTTPYPGSLVAIPVVGAALIIAGGISAPVLGAEWLLRRQPFAWIGKRSYSLYLWHWPILIVAAEQAGRSTLSTGENVLLIVLVAVPLSHFTYLLVENPIRHMKFPSFSTVIAGLTLVLATWLVLSYAISVYTPASLYQTVVPAPSTAALLDAVAASSSITHLPANLDPGLAGAFDDFPDYARPFDFGCAYTATIQPRSKPLCTIGDPKGQRLMVVYGDSHAIMWLPALESIALRSHWRLIVLARYFCPADLVTVSTPLLYGSPNDPYLACSQWHQWIVNVVRDLKPNLFLVSQESDYEHPSTTGPQLFTAHDWQAGLASLLSEVAAPGTREVVLGNVPTLAESAPECLQVHTKDVQACSTPVAMTINPLSQVERTAAAQTGAQYLNPYPWFCTTTCAPVVDHYLVYRDHLHITSTYAEYAENALGQALGFSSST